MVEEQLSQVEVPVNVTVDEPSCLFFDGQAPVMALGKPPGIAFGEYANIFINTVFRMGATFRRIDVDFARYRTGINSS